MNIQISLIAVLVFLLGWWLIGKFPDAFIKLFLHKVRKTYMDDVDTLHVFSSETTRGDEAEFVNETLPGKKEVIRAFRFILTLIFLAVIIILLYSNYMGL